MPWDEVMGKYKAGELHSGSKSGPKAKSRKQAIAIMLSEKEKAMAGKSEYKSKKKKKKKVVSSRGSIAHDIFGG
jgi:hypothetical protein